MKLSVTIPTLLASGPWSLAHASLPPTQQVVLGPGDTGESPLTGVRNALIASQIIPTVIDDFEPLFLLDIDWKKKSAQLGNTLKVKKVKHQPEFSLKLSQDASPADCTSNMTYVVTLTDPDAPSRSNPKWSEMCHFIGAGLAISPSEESCAELQLTKLRDVMPYKPPGPPPKTGKHRYVFLVFAPANGTTDDLYPSKPTERQHWGGDKGHGVRDWAWDNGLIPVAANFIYAENKKQ
jgi:phosphatidylethanolamine-binding protein (PEBP) family uncharacterized protein